MTDAATLRATILAVISDRRAYQQLRVAERERALEATDLREGIRLAEALLTSTVLRVARRARRPRPLGLARALGISAEAISRVARPVR